MCLCQVPFKPRQTSSTWDDGLKVIKSSLDPKRRRKPHRQILFFILRHSGMNTRIYTLGSAAPRYSTSGLTAWTRQGQSGTSQGRRCSENSRRAIQSIYILYALCAVRVLVGRRRARLRAIAATSQYPTSVFARGRTLMGITPDQCDELHHETLLKRGRTAYQGPLRRYSVPE